MPLKIKGCIKRENWHKCLGFSVWLRYWVCRLNVKKRKEKGILRSQLSFSAILCLSISHSFCFFVPAHLSTSFVRKCLNKITVSWRVVSKAQRHSMLMLNLFCIHLRWRGLVTLPSWSYSLPSSSRLRAHTSSSLLIDGSMSASLFIPLLLRSCSLLAYKSFHAVIIFQAVVLRMQDGADAQKHSSVSSSAKSLHKSPS